ncbi:hypothetical protein DB346_09770 [Verrucomicrobia bacterium LW23]|nr:hypothetical protein DB346_09770 [Verrucomicrobia bacterium LW23]
MHTKPAFHKITNLRVSAGFLAGISIPFKDGLNCLIGPRGSGKSSSLELIRYALAAMPGRDDVKDPLRKRVQTVIKTSLNGGRVELGIETREGMKYTVSRAVDEAPLMISEDNTTLAPESLSHIFQVDIYSQNQIETIAETPRYQLELLDKFRESELRNIQSQIDKTKSALVANAEQIVPLGKEKQELKSELTQLEPIKQKLKSVAKISGQNTEEMNRLHAAKALRDRELQAYDHALQQLSHFRQQLLALTNQYEGNALSFFGADMTAGANGEMISNTAAIVQEAVVNAERNINAAADEIEKARSLISGRLRTELTQAHGLQDRQYHEFLEKQKQDQAVSAERVKLERQHNALLFKEKRVEEITVSMTSLQNIRNRLLSVLSEQRDALFAIRFEIATMLNSKLEPTIKISIQQDADGEAFRQLLELRLKAGNLQHGVVARKLSSSVNPLMLADMIKKGDTEELARRGGISSDQAEKVMELLRNQAIIMELEVVEMEDVPRIDLSDHGVYKNSVGLSTGQKCTAILPILLFDSANPLIIDQPEDNLDNRYVYECVVEAVRKVKSSRQLIFITHNPNIPVLGDAENVIVLKSDGWNGQLEETGSVDQCRASIVNLLEGGKEAFRLRSERYNGAAI